MIPEKEEAGWSWRKSSRSGGESGNCVKVGFRPGHRALRDSKDAARQTLRLTPDGFERFLSWVRTGAVD